MTKDQSESGHDKERFSLYVSDGLYSRYILEAARQKATEGKKGVSVSSLIGEAMEAYAKKFK